MGSIWAKRSTTERAPNSGAQLDQIAASDEFARLMARAGSIVEELGVVRGYCGEALGRQMGLFQEASAELAPA